MVRSMRGKLVGGREGVVWAELLFWKGEPVLFGTCLGGATSDATRFWEVVMDAREGRGGEGRGGKVEVVPFIRSVSTCNPPMNIVFSPGLTGDWLLVSRKEDHAVTGCLSTSITDPHVQDHTSKSIAMSADVASQMHAECSSPQSNPAGPPTDAVLTAIQQLDSILASPQPDNKKKRPHRLHDTSISTPALMDILSSSTVRSYLPASLAAGQPVKKRKRRLSIVLANSARKDLELNERIKRTWRPSSLDDLLDRVSTYSLSMWNDNKPSPPLSLHLRRSAGRDKGKGRTSAASTPPADTVDIDIGVLAFARYGWRCPGSRREEVACVTCGRTWTCEQVKDWRSDEGKAAALRIQGKLKEEHSSGCPWRYGPSDGKCAYGVHGCGLMVGSADGRSFATCFLS